MTNELILTNSLIAILAGLPAGSIAFFILKALTKKTNLSGVLSIILGLVLNIVFFLNAYFDHARYNYNEHVAWAINQSFFNNFMIFIMWVIGTIIFWVSTKKYENAKIKKSKR